MNYFGVGFCVTLLQNDKYFIHIYPTLRKGTML